MIVRGVSDGRGASAMAAAQGPQMRRAMLALYRSAAQPAMARLGRDLEHAARTPGLAILATRDAVAGTDAHRRRAAARAGAQVAALDAGHWWHIEAPEAVAETLGAFWSRADLLSDTQVAAA